jgi:hypothetical protein
LFDDKKVSTALALAHDFSAGVKLPLDKPPGKLLKLPVGQGLE